MMPDTKTEIEIEKEKDNTPDPETTGKTGIIDALKAGFMIIEQTKTASLKADTMIDSIDSTITEATIAITEHHTGPTTIYQVIMERRIDITITTCPTGENGIIEQQVLQKASTTRAHQKTFEELPTPIPAT